MTTRGLGLMGVAWCSCWGESLVVSFVFFFGVRAGRVVAAVGETVVVVVAVWSLANAELLAGSRVAGSSAGSSGWAENDCHSVYADKAAEANGQR